MENKQAASVDDILTRWTTLIDEEGFETKFDLNSFSGLLKLYND